MADETAGTRRPASIAPAQRDAVRAWSAGDLAHAGTLWPDLRDALKTWIREVRGDTNGLNVYAFDAHATPILHRAAPLAPLLREQGARGAAWDLLVSEHELDERDWQDFFPAHVAPPNDDAPTWDTVLEGQALERACSDVCAMLDEFDEPPFTLQRLAELLVEPHEHYHTRSKYLAALARVLSVSPVAQAPSAPAAPDSPVFRMRASSESTPIYAPIPFLAPVAKAGGAGAPPVPEGLGVPPGPIDELDSTEARGAVTDVVQPLSATTHVDVPEKRARTHVEG
ncbi:hypothetical protein MCAP1_002522 [Malassezia caprae]|uniref:Uncharacterized protein n=1 Tax=Malassezia caprae TaxID=1381934 RepID=A0AAF0E747_9BASI|nr:hypothetical protein MCAP1_002522 [Malassezia caprae]